MCSQSIVQMRLNASISSNSLLKKAITKSRMELSPTALPNPNNPTKAASPQSARFPPLNTFLMIKFTT